MFIQENKAKSKLKAGQLAYGVISTSDDPQIAELFGLAGFDYYMLDAEHGLIDTAQMMSVIRACELVNMAAMVRIGSKDPKLVLQYLDAQAMVIPQFNDAALIDRFEQMISQPVVDAGVIVPRDLSLNMGFPDGPN